jgi:hypothetical protein
LKGTSATGRGEKDVAQPETATAKAKHRMNTELHRWKNFTMPLLYAVQVLFDKPDDGLPQDFPGESVFIDEG